MVVRHTKSLDIIVPTIFFKQSTLSIGSPLIIIGAILPKINDHLPCIGRTQWRLLSSHQGISLFAWGMFEERVRKNEWASERASERAMEGGRVGGREGGGGGGSAGGREGGPVGGRANRRKGRGSGVPLKTRSAFEDTRLVVCLSGWLNVQVRACVLACVGACVRACMCEYVHACLREWISELARTDWMSDWLMEWRTDRYKWWRIASDHHFSQSKTYTCNLVGSRRVLALAQPL